MRQVTLREAALILGISDGAARKRYERGSLEGEAGEDGRIYVWVDEEHPTYTPDSRLIGRLEDEVEYLKEQLEAEKEAHREARRIIGGLVQRVPEISSSASSSTKANVENLSQAQEGEEEIQPVKSTSWLKRLFSVVRY